MSMLLDYEIWLRLIVFIAVLLALLGAEVYWPRRGRERTRGQRWGSNFGIVVIDTLLLRIAFPVAAIGTALWAESTGFGLLNILNVPLWLSVVASLLLLDFAIWAQHLMFHRVPWLWRMHRLHHADVDMDVTTALRFHPLEILLSMLIKIGVVVLFGAPAVAVLLFEVILNATAMFNHSNIRLRDKADKWLRRFVVTPDMHRVHHSWHVHETDSNFGFNLPWWDRLFGTYRAQPEDGHDNMTIGINQFRQADDNKLHRLLLQPFVGPTHSKPTQRRGHARESSDT
ncbi:MAG: sterol desaturase family protein [Idiomarina sp.]|nr:sterol desaturase family protein [Idiomarina sp.]